MKAKALEKRARDMIVAIIMENGEMETEEIMDLIRPHFLFDLQRAKEQAIRRKAHQLASQIRDEKGVRTVFACNDDGISKYVNIDTSKNVEDLKSVEKQLNTKLIGLYASRSKASARRTEVEGQMRLDLTQMTQEEKIIN